MSADDLILLLISLSDLQIMIDICLQELSLLDMQINARKSCAVRIDKRFDIPKCGIYLNGVPLPWKSELCYLDITFRAAKALHCNFHAAKCQFFGSVNSLLGKIGTLTFVALTLSLTTSKCSQFCCMVWNLSS